MSTGLDSSVDVVLENAKLAELSYLPYNQGILQKGFTFNAFNKDGETYVLDGTYEVLEHSAPATNTIFDTTLDDFAAVLLKKVDTDEYVVAFRGTLEIIDWDSNISTFLSNYNPQADEGLEFVEAMIQAYQINVNNLTLTGHSLGGIIAQFVSAELRTQAYTYNSFGANLLSSLPALGVPFYSVIGQIMDILGLGDKNDPWVKDNILNISFQDDGLVNGDILSNLGTQFTELLAGNDFLGGVLPESMGSDSIDFRL